MKQFFKFLFASALGFVVGAFLLIFLLIGLASAMISGSGDETFTPSENSVLHLKLDQPIQERTSKNPFEDFDLNTFEAKQKIGLTELIENIDKAAHDSKIKGIFLDLNNFSAGIATTEEIRNALIAFKKSKKFVFSYSENYTQGAYYLASVSNEIFLNPQGSMILNGLCSQLLFYKGTLDKLEIEPQIIRHGKYKSAIEPFIRENMSDENRLQIAEYVNPIWNHLLTEIANQRKIDRNILVQVVDSFKIQEPNDAVQNKLVDKLMYEDEFIAKMNSACSGKANLVEFKDYRHAKIEDNKPFAKDKIAVIYCSGDIVSGNGEDDEVGSEKIVKAIENARLDNKVKAIVLRVNSPGGSALASDIIWRAIEIAKTSKKVVVSMGDVAASGGYYISCNADKIYAQPNTITGSIGVFGLMFNAEKLLKNKLGISADSYKTNEYADIGTSLRKMTAGEELIYQRSVDKVYQTFILRVANGRKMSIQKVDEIAQGRVWSGVNAKAIGLVDEFGGLIDAIKAAAQLAKIKDYRIKELPFQEEPFKKLFKDISTEAKLFLFEEQHPLQQQISNQLHLMMSQQGIQAKCFYNVGFN